MNNNKSYKYFYFYIRYYFINFIINYIKIIFISIKF